MLVRIKPEFLASLFLMPWWIKHIIWNINQAILWSLFFALLLMRPDNLIVTFLDDSFCPSTFYHSWFTHLTTIRAYWNVTWWNMFEVITFTYTMKNFFQIHCEADCIFWKSMSTIHLCCCRHVSFPISEEIRSASNVVFDCFNPNQF